jgi:DNA-binding NarL/FixJ family response regulator
MYYIAIIEDNLKVQQVLSDFISIQPDMKLVLRAASYEEFIQNWGGRKLDLVLCDIGLPGKSGIDVVWYIKARSEETFILMLTVFDDREKIFAAFSAGASGYLLKGTSLEDILKGMIEILNGGAVMSPRVARHVTDFFYRKPSAISAEAELSFREMEIIALIRQGFSNKQVADKLFISVDTIKYHIKNTYRKLQVSSRAELIIKYKEYLQ